MTLRFMRGGGSGRQDEDLSSISRTGGILERIQWLNHHRKNASESFEGAEAFQHSHYVRGGFAVQEHGYPRFTVDVDIIVPDVEFAMEKLSINGFKANSGSKMIVTDRETKVEVDLLPGGKKVDPGPLTLPMPTHVSGKPQVLRLKTLISSKLSTYMGRGIERSQDYADVVKLVQANDLPRDYGVDPRVRAEYHKIWDGIHQGG